MIINFFMGREITFIQAIIISKLDFFIGGSSNISFAIKYLFNKEINFINVDNGKNSKSLLYSFFLWRIKSLLPSGMGGFKSYK